ncbi:3 beta-hydroxysteroid dehydrogenase/Delta 5--_4-isomerase type 3 [Nymphon striatum]|nr:3 beta-hydroxysteroid dehydrogenase/Delta 5-->4-isomerase type 3 [Nymphon striatum]
MSSKISEVVLVTGSSGFLGQHIVKLLQERDNNCTHIKLLDIKPYENKLGHSTEKPMEKIVADITDLNAISNAFKDVDCVFHAAADVSVGIASSKEWKEKVNVLGTANVVQACLAHGVRSLVMTSTVDVNIGCEEIVNGTEKNTDALPSSALFYDYAETKYRAERVVLDANNKRTQKDDVDLHSLVLRPTVMYGEQDGFLLYNLLKSAKNRKSKVTQIGDGSALTQLSYVGNVAWAHIVSKDKLAISPKSVSGEVYFITDDTEIANPYQTIKPYAEAMNLSVGPTKMPGWILYGIIALTEIIFTWINKFRENKIYVPASAGITYITRTYTFSRTKANLMLNYKPIYNSKESFQNSLEFYLHCNY